MGIELAVDEKQFAFPAQHPFHRGRRMDIAKRIQGRVGNQQDTFQACFRGLRVLYDDCAVEAGKDLVSHTAMMMGVVPVDARRMIPRETVFIIEGGARINSDERIVTVALG